MACQVKTPPSAQVRRPSAALTGATHHRFSLVVAAVLLSAASLLWAATPLRAETLELPLPEARLVALQAATQGQPDIALDVTARLLALNPEDGLAHLARSTAFLMKRAWSSAYRGGRLAFRHATDREGKYHSARVAALAAVGANRNLLAQYWFRRAGDFAETDRERARVEEQFRVIKSRSAVRFRFDASVMPSSNVNGGSESAYNIIDGLPYIGILTADAQALSGYIGQMSLRGTFRLSESPKHRTHLETGFYTRRVGLSDEAQAAAPAFDASTLSVTTLDVGLRRTQLLAKDGPILSFHGALRGYWQGGTRSYMGVGGGVDLSHALTERITLFGGAEFEARNYEGGGDGEIKTARVGLSYTFPNGNRLSGNVQVTDSTTPYFALDSDSVWGKVSLSFAQPVAGILFSTGIGMSHTDFPDYAIGFIPVPGGRQDEAIFFDVDATFTGLEFAGFSPSLRLRRSETTSNVSRFETSEWAVSLGIRSNF